jgi:hypothetical protein
MILLTSHRRTPGDSFKRQQESWRHAYAQAPSMKDRFPGIELIVVQIAFTDSRDYGRYSAQMRSLSPAAKAFFAIPCPRTLCLDGGFDLDAVIAGLVTAGRMAAAGKLECVGWVDASGSKHANCGLRLSYEIRAEYRASAHSGSDGRRQV